VPPRARKDNMLGNGCHEAGPPRGGPGLPRAEAGPPGLERLGLPGGRTSYPSGEEVRCRHVSLRERLLNQRRLVSGGFQSLREANPTTALNVGGWGERARDRAWAAL
jgi:hypothetical protein